MSDWGEDDLEELTDGEGFQGEEGVGEDEALAPVGDVEDAPASEATGEHEVALAPAEQKRPLYYANLDEFVAQFLCNAYRRRIDGRSRCWAGRWWDYEEALHRLDALWMAWEHLRWDPTTGMSSWWRDHADHHMPVLMSPDGPFAGASEGEENTCSGGEPLPYVEPPPGMFPDQRGRRDTP